MALNATRLDNVTLGMFTNNTASYTLSAVYIIVFCINLPGNGFSLWLLLFHTKPKTPSIIFMINLTITDLALCMFLPFQIAYLINSYDWTFGETLCSLVSVMFYSNMYCSILTMTAISVERYFGVVHPMRFDCKRTRYALAACLAMWGIVLLVLYPLLSTDLTYRVKELNITTCFDVLKKDMLPSVGAWAAFLFTLFGVLFLIPFLLTVFCYTGIIRKLVKTSKYGSAQKKRAVYLAVMVLFVFISCFAPNNLILFAHMIGKLFYNKSFYPAYKLTLSLSCLNSCLDPFIYYFASKEFRRKFRHLLSIQANNSDTNTVDFRKESFFSARSLSQGQAEDEVDVRSSIYKRKESFL